MSGWHQSINLPRSLSKLANTAQKVKFSIKDFFSKCDQIRTFLRIWSHLLKKFSMEKLIFSAVKVAKLKPVFKKGKKNDLSNFMPISLLPIIFKIIRKILYDQTNAFLSEENICRNYQSGFRANHSANLCSSFLTDIVLNGSDEGLFPWMFLIDLKEAFQALDHDIFLQKLKTVRFSKRFT